MDWKTLFLSVEGRIGQKDFWTGFALLFVVSFVLGKIEVISWLWSLASIYFGVCVGGKRLHDIGKSAWFVVLPIGIILAAYAFGAILGSAAFLGMAATGSDSAAFIGGFVGLGLVGIVGFIGFVAGIGMVIWLGTRKSDLAENQFGPPREIPLVTAA